MVEGDTGPLKTTEGEENQIHERAIYDCDISDES